MQETEGRFVALPMEVGKIGGQGTMQRFLRTSPS